MVKNFYCIRDKVAEVFHRPFTLNNDQEAIRAFRNTVFDPQVPDKDDLELYKIGTFNDNNGVIEPTEVIRLITGFEVSNNETVK